jgi:hypothetical protein
LQIPGTDLRQCNPGSGIDEILLARLTFRLFIAAPARNTDRSLTDRERGMVEKA